MLRLLLIVMQSLVNIVWSYGTLKWYRRPIMDAVEVEILARLRGCGRCGQHLSLLPRYCITYAKSS